MNDKISNVLRMIADQIDEECLVQSVGIILSSGTNACLIVLEENGIVTMKAISQSLMQACDGLQNPPSNGPSFSYSEWRKFFNETASVPQRISNEKAR